MVVLSRNEIRRARTGGFLTLILALAVLAGIVLLFSQAPPLGQALLFALGVAALAAVLLSVLQIASYEGPSKAILFHQGDRTVLASNHLHEGFKLRFFRDLLGENMVSFSDEERNEWQALRKEGFHPVLKAQNVRKTYLLSLCGMVFDDVYVFDHHGRWDYFNCRNTSEPTFSQRDVRPFADDSVIPGRQRPTG